MYKPLSVLGHLEPGNGDNQNVFPLDKPVYFVNAISEYEGESSSYRVHKFDACGGVRISSVNQ